MPGRPLPSALPLPAQPLLILMPQTVGSSWDPVLLHRWLATVPLRYRATTAAST